MVYPELRLQYREERTEQGIQVTTQVNMSPQEFVEALTNEQEYLYVTAGDCDGCLYTPLRALSREHIQQATRLFRTHGVFPECLCGALARHLRWEYPQAPSFVVCYGYYYQHWQESAYLRAVTEARRVRFYPREQLPRVEEAKSRGLGFIGYTLLPGEE